MPAEPDTCPHADAGAHGHSCDAHADCDPGSDPDTCPHTVSCSVCLAIVDAFTHPDADCKSDAYAFDCTDCFADAHTYTTNAT